MITYMLEDSDRQSSFHCQTGAACVHRHVSPLLSWKRGRGPPNLAIAPPANVSQYELHALLQGSQVSKWLSGGFWLNKIRQESPGCPAVARRDHAVCLAAEHAESQGSARLHKIADADAEGAVRFSPFRLFYQP